MKLKSLQEAMIERKRKLELLKKQLADVQNEIAANHDAPWVKGGTLSAKTNKDLGRFAAKEAGMGTAALLGGLLKAIGSVREIPDGSVELVIPAQIWKSLL